MAAQPDPVNGFLDDLLQRLQDTFRAFLCAHATIELGGGILDSIRDNVAIGAVVGLNIAIEPIPLAELKQYKASFPGVLLEVFHGKVVQTWKECLSKIFAHYVSLHLNGTRRFEELKSTDVRLDFRSDVSIDEQIRNSLVDDFDFKRYADQQKLIDGLRNPNDLYPNHLTNVHKNVLMRNALQHKGGRVDQFFLNSLGVNQIEVLGQDAQPIPLGDGDRVTLSIPEFDSFRRSTLMVCQAWRS